MSEGDVPTFKVVMMGDSGVGKTSIVLQLSEHVFRAMTKPTVGSGCVEKRITTPSGPVRLSIWDTAGEERYRSVTSLYSQGAEAFVLVFDITDEATFDSIPGWIQTFDQISSEGCLVYVVGNKIDMEGRQVAETRAFEWCQQHEYRYYEVSAKTGERVELVFSDIAEKLAQKKSRANARITTPVKKETDEKRGCC